ncbi:CPBP family intramembrane metalloprotease [Bacillus luteolus]|uniref:CPBP family intramembrane metalloprotease n=1 Tax=Litchfieldia luteola TaxID=682179 RepID=A0ABR9QH46_9BACI|nr:CPBP family intramembrane glutamic endopeptidase [Cytobacillus luteolus]MBE4907818.1 CPBP family intramembrane metalloprotease [Cytobacillus luteolus]MBP1944025.1 membrane protease YdiL (CAAX protease family) [Cytobacillus luteolus]
MYWYILIFSILICLPGIIFSSISESKMSQSSKNNQGDRVGPFSIILVLLLVVSVLSAAGAYFVLKMNMLDPFLSSLLKGNFDKNEFFYILFLSVSLGILVACINMFYYYFVLKRQVGNVVYSKINQLYANVGILTRVFFGGVVEEIIFRWVGMSFLIWLGSLVVGDINTYIIWGSILIMSFLFALAHLPGATEVLGGKISIPVQVYAIGMNVVVGIACGWAFWEVGILASIIIHMLFHLLWYPVQRYVSSKDMIVNTYNN